MSRFKGKLVEMIKDANSRFDDCSISPRIRQILLIGLMDYLKVIYCNFVFIYFCFFYFFC